jgi:hypothetical protein
VNGGERLAAILLVGSVAYLAAAALWALLS